MGIRVASQKKLRMAASFLIWGRCKNLSHASLQHGVNVVFTAENADHKLIYEFAARARYDGSRTESVGLGDFLFVKTKARERQRTQRIRSQLGHSEERSDVAISSSSFRLYSQLSRRSASLLVH